MILLIGLGNPGKEYERTPHNIGFSIIEWIKEQAFSSSSWQKKFDSEFLEGKIKDKTVLMARPLTFMNNSGSAVKQLISYHNIELENIWIIHDELDLPMGTLRVDVGRNAAGHKGVQSVIDALGTNNFWRIRVGVRPEPYPDDKEELNRYLTDKPMPEDKRHIIVERASILVGELIKNGIRTQDCMLLDAW